MKKSIFISSLLLVPFLLFGQLTSLSRPNIINYPKSEYKAGTQNWDCAQDPDGFMYFANKEGLLYFDGLEWKLYPVSATSPIRSLAIDDEGVIYLGFDTDFGIFDPHKQDGSKYKSLKDKIKPDIGDTDIIWKIHCTQQGVVFQSFSYVFILKNDQLSVIVPKEAFYHSFYVNKRLFIQEPGVGIFELSNGFTNKLSWADTIKDKKIVSIISFYDNHYLIGTINDGWYEYVDGKLNTWDTPANKIIEDDVLFCATLIDGNKIAFGTVLNGLVIADRQGKIKQHLNDNKGLLNNTVLSLYKDKSNNLWVGLDNGISYIELNSPLSYISSPEGISTGYSSILHEGLLYLGTNQGLFVMPLDDSNDEKFELVAGTEGQVWTLKVFNRQLICGHNRGTYIINRKKATQINDTFGTLTVVQSQKDPNIFIGGNYDGLNIYHNKPKGWKHEASINDFTEACRFIADDQDGNIWISHSEKGIFKLVYNEVTYDTSSTKLYTEKEGLPSCKNNRIIHLNNSWYVSTASGLYRYNKDKDQFEKDIALNECINIEGQIKSIDVDQGGNIWYIGGKGMGVIRKNEEGQSIHLTTPFKQLEDKLVKDWNFFYEYEKNNVLIATEDGFAHYALRNITPDDRSLSCHITSIDVPYLASTLYESINIAEQIFPYEKNEFRFHFASPFYSVPESIEFSYFIDNYSREWSPWSQANYRDFTNLPSRSYVFRVKSRNCFGVESEEVIYSFSISPPWYLSQIAYFSYFLLLMVSIGTVFIVFKQRMRLAKQKEQERNKKELLKKEREYQKQALESEKEIIQLKNDKLAAEKLSLDKELANQTLNGMNKNKFLMKIDQELKHVLDNTADGIVKSKIVLIKRRINKEINNNHQEKLFESHFEAVHADFFTILKERFPKLSPKDVRLCAYIKMNMSTKEIAPLLNISERGVEISRYRLRKKLDLSRDINLTSFLFEL